MNALQLVPGTAPAKDGDVRFVLEVGSAMLEIQARCYPLSTPSAAEWRALQEAHEQTLTECGRLQAALAEAAAGRPVLREPPTADRDALMARLEEAEKRAANAEAARNDLAEKLREAQASFRELARDRALDQLAHEKSLRELESRPPAAAAPVPVPEEAPAKTAVTVAVPRDDVPASVAAAATGRAGRTAKLNEWERESLALQEKLQSAEGRWRGRDERREPALT